MSFATNLEFTPVHFEPQGRKDAKTVRIAGSRLTISSKMVRELDWKDGDRVDLLQSGAVFCLERNPVGVFTLRDSNKTAKTMVIQSAALTLHIKAFIGEGLMEAFSDGRKLYFRKGEGA